MSPHDDPFDALDVAAEQRARAAARHFVAFSALQTARRLHAVRTRSLADHMELLDATIDATVAAAVKVEEADRLVLDGIARVVETESAAREWLEHETAVLEAEESIAAHIAERRSAA